MASPTIGRVFTPKLETLLGPARQPQEPLDARHEAIAASLQHVYEEAAFHVLRALHRRTRNPRLCLAGGCAMNSVANGKIRARDAVQGRLHPAGSRRQRHRARRRATTSGTRSAASRVVS